MPDSSAGKQPARSQRMVAGEDGHAVQWYCRVFGTEFGPLPFATLCEMTRTGQLGADDPVRSSDLCYWQPACRVTALQPFLPGRDLIANDSGSTRERTGKEPLLDQWFYQVDRREHGPFTLASIQDLIGSSGQTAEQVLMRHSSRHEWTSFYELPANATMARARNGTLDAGATSESHAGRLRSASNSPSPGLRSLRQFLSDNRVMLIAAVVWGLLNITMLSVWSDPYSTERKYYTTLRRLEDEIHALRSQNAPPGDWIALRAKAKGDLDPMIADLKNSASAAEPVRQHLLWAARDQMPKLIRPERAEKEVERVYKNHMQFLEGNLGNP